MVLRQFSSPIDLIPNWKPTKLCLILTYVFWKAERKRFCNGFRNRIVFCFHLWNMVFFCPWYTDESAGPGIGSFWKLLLNMFHSFHLLHGPYHFFETTSFKIWWSRLRFAYMRLSLTFSSSSSLSLLLSEAVIPKYLPFQL